MRPALLALLLTCLTAPTAVAQTRDVKTLSLDGARKVADAAEAEARRRGWDVAVAVVDPAGGLIVFHRMDGVQDASLDIANVNSRTPSGNVPRHARPTRRFSLMTLKIS